MCTWVHPQLLPLRNLPFPPPQKRPADQTSTGCPQSRKSPKILQILLQTIRPFPRCQKDPPPNHQPLARNPENPPKSCKSCFRQPALSPAAKKTRRPTINRSPAILKIPQNPANPASDNPPFPRRKKDPPPNHQPFACNPENPPKSCKSCFRQHPPQIWDAPLLSFQLALLSLIRDTKRMEVLYTELFDK